MALDAMFIRHLAHELNAAISGARIDKIHQPERDEIIMNLRTVNGAARLLISAGANYPRVHLTGKTKENPQTPPMFCMLMRKYLTNGRIISVSQPGLERAIDIEIEVNDEMGVPTRRIVGIEMMGRYSNIILRDSEGRITDCLKRIDIEMSELRQVLPGLFYELPPSQGKLDPCAFSRAEILDILVAADCGTSIEKWLLSTFAGVSPLICREVAARAGVDADMPIQTLDIEGRLRIASELFRICADNAVPTILIDGDMPKDFSFCEIMQYGAKYSVACVPTFSELLDRFYGERDRATRMRARSQSLLKSIRNAHSRAERKLAIQREEVRAALGRERERELGDIITANIHALSRGMTEFTAQDFYSTDGALIKIKLDIRLSPQQNAARHYKDYNRMKNAEHILAGQIEKGESEIAYLESVLEMINQAESESDLTEIRDELAETGYASATGGKKRQKPLRPREFRSSDGYRIYAGRNNRQNDLLTMKSALKGDVWMHTQKIPGTHVIIECSGEMPPDTTLTEAAHIAAFFSRARGGESIPVDYTQVRNVKKPPGARPGMVIYAKFKTAFVTPIESEIRQLEETGRK